LAAEGRGWMNIGRRFKYYFFRGLAVLLPTTLTLWILAWGYAFVQANISVHINRGLVWLIQKTQGPNGLPKAHLDDILVYGMAGSVVGFLIALAIIVLVGALLASVVGRGLWRLVEVFILNTPFLKRVYPYVKQVTDFILSDEDQKRMFSRVVAVEYPRRGMWSLGFVTGAGIQKVARECGKELLTVMVASSPTPVTGYVIVVPREETIALDMTVEEAVRFLVSGGVISPDREPPRVVSLPKACGAA
jgi:uncharacterized membrane protein